MAIYWFIAQKFSNFKRSLHLHEYQSQSLLKQCGVNVPAGSVASTPEEAEKIAEFLGNSAIVALFTFVSYSRSCCESTDSCWRKRTWQVWQWLQKWSALVQYVRHSSISLKYTSVSPQQAREIAAKMLGNRLITKQTGLEGKPVNKVLVCRRYFLRRETYLGILLDRSSQGPVIISSPQGGMDIEKVAAENPAAIFKEPVELDKGPSTEQTKRIAQNLGFPTSLHSVVQAQIKSMYKFFLDKDATMLEINPFVETSAGEGQ